MNVSSARKWTRYISFFRGIKTRVNNIIKIKKGDSFITNPLIFYSFISSFNAFPALNTGAIRAGIFIEFPV